MTSLVDCHAHLETLEDIKIILLRAKEAGISKIITCGSSCKWSTKCVKIAENDSGNLVQIFACVGVHPHDGKDEILKLGDLYLTQLRNLSTSKKVVAIGECGMDFYEEGEKRPADTKVLAGKQLTTDKDVEFQKKLFLQQIELACELKKPLVIHCRNAWDQILSILEQNKSKLTKGGMFHSWTGTLEDAKRAIKLGFYISISGIVTFKNAGEIVDVAKWVPIDRLLLETDSPFLSPVPVRGKTNEPKNVRITAQFVAKLRGVSFEEISEATTRNAEKLFGI